MAKCVCAVMAVVLLVQCGVADEMPRKFPDLPTGVTSFGAATLNGALYVYGGHKGEAHQYYVKGQSNELWKLDLSQPEKWEVVATGPRLQGLALVAHGDSLYRLGGFTARNKQGEEHDLLSVPDFARFNLATGNWETLVPMPQPRSSFDAVVVGNLLYVAGGWALKGGSETEWHSSAYVVDLAADPLAWRALPPPPFQRRAVSLGACDGRVYVIGGMQPQGGPTTSVFAYDPRSQQWSEGPALVGEPMAGFGSSAFALGERLFVTTFDGTLQELVDNGTRWKVVKKLERARFFHRLVPFDEQRLISVGGANMQIGKFLEVDVIAPE